MFKDLKEALKFFFSMYLMNIFVTFIVGLILIALYFTFEFGEAKKQQLISPNAVKKVELKQLNLEHRIRNLERILIKKGGKR